MGTRGFRIIKFKGRYWIFYNNWDSYPDGLGKSLVKNIPVDPEEYLKWLQSQRDLFAKWDSLLQRLLTIYPEDIRKLQTGEVQKPVFHTAFYERLQVDAAPYYQSGINDFSVEWTYTIDLDREIFSVDSGAHFLLSQIPKTHDWDEALFVDNQGHRFLLPHLVPAESVASLAIDPTPGYTTSTKYESLKTREVVPKSLDHISPTYLTGPRLRWMLFNFFRETRERDLSICLLGWQVQDLPFREFVFFILCLAAGGDHLALVDEHRFKMPHNGSLYVGMMTNDISESDTELATCLGVGYHLNGLPIGSAPEESKYWFEGALICLIQQLNHPGILEMAIAEAIEYGRAKCTAQSFNAVLISIEHLVLVRSLADGSVDHTGVLPLIPITIHMSKDARARYGDQLLDSFYDAKFPKEKLEVDEPDAMDVEQLGQNPDQYQGKSYHSGCNNEDSKKEEQDYEEEPKEMQMEEHCSEANIEHEGAADSETTEDDTEDAEVSGKKSEQEVELIQADPVQEVTVRSSFMALIQFFEATSLENLRPTQPNEARLPEEICEMVLRNVSDTKTYNSCLKVSRRFRQFCQQRPLVMDNVVFIDPLHKKPRSSIGTTLKEDQGSLAFAKEKKEGIRKAQLPDFLAVDVSSGRQARILFREFHSYDDALTYLVVAGSVE